LIKNKLDSKTEDIALRELNAADDKDKERLSKTFESHSRITTDLLNAGHSRLVTMTAPLTSP
jgi:hypothetical protein